jgi:hypothetical protein
MLRRLKELALKAGCMFAKSTELSLQNFFDHVAERKAKQLVRYLDLEDSSAVETLKMAEEFRQYIWECLHAQHWSKIDRVYRELYGFAALMVCMTMAHNLESYPSSFILTIADSGILMGDDTYHRVLQELIESCGDSETSAVQVSRKLRGAETITQSARKLLIRPSLPASEGHFIHKTDKLAILPFYQNHLLTSRPVVITGAIEDWPAMAKWYDPAYISKGNIVYKVPTSGSTDVANF